MTLRKRDRSPLGAAGSAVVIFVNAPYRRLRRRTRDAHVSDAQARLEITHAIEKPLPTLLLRRREAGVRRPYLRDVAGFERAGVAVDCVLNIRFRVGRDSGDRYRRPRWRRHRRLV